MGDVFLQEDVQVELAAPAAQQRLLEHLRLGGLEDAWRPGRQVSVRFLQPIRRGSAFVVPLRWMVTGPAGGLFPHLDANLELTPVDDTHSRLTLVGVYTPPLGPVGEHLDRLVLHQVAGANCRRLLRQLADDLARPGPVPLTGRRYDGPQRWADPQSA